MLKKWTKQFIAICAALLLSTGVSHSFEFGVFSDVTVGDSSAAGENSQFALGGLDFYGTSMIDDKTRVFIEYVFENTDDGLVTDLERLWISREIASGFTVAVGRFHTPLGSWNRAYHHGAVLQDTVSRPFFLDFEDGTGAILPVHIVGLMASGSVPVSLGAIDYSFYVANGPSINSDVAVAADREIEINGQGDPNNDKSVGFRTTLILSPVDMAMSVFGMYNTIADSGSMLAAKVGDPLVTQTIAGADLAATFGDFDVLAEAYLLQNKDEVGNLGTQQAGAYYTQFGYQLTEKWKLVARHEQIMTKEGGDRYFNALGTKDARNEVLGVKYDLDDTNSLKLEVNSFSPDDSAADSTTGVRLQWAFLVP